jgi:uncharacterized protein (DUF2384 family)
VQGLQASYAALPGSTVRRKLTANKPLPLAQSERLLGLQRVIGLVEVMIAESGDDDKTFDAPGWMARWLDEASPALGNKKPGEFMDTMAGQELVSTLLARMQSGVFA